MKPKFVLKTRYPASPLCIEGMVNREEHDRISLILGQYRMDHPDYKLCADSGCFYEVGSDWMGHSQEQKIVIVFETERVEHIHKFINRINEVVG